MKLASVKISKFKSINSLTLDLKDKLILVGENSSGKSNILKAIDLFYQDSIRGINEEHFYNKDKSIPIEIVLTYDRLSDDDRAQKYLKHWIYEDNIKVRKLIKYDVSKNKFEAAFYGWQAKAREMHFDLSRFEEYKGKLKELIEKNKLPDYFKTAAGSVTQSSYKEGVSKHIEAGLVEFGNADWIENPAGLKEVFSDLLPQFYLVPAIKDAQEESKTTQQTFMGKLVADLTNRIVSKNPEFGKVKQHLEDLKKFLNRKQDGSDSERLTEIKDFESTISGILSESMPGSKIGIEIVTPDLIDLFKDIRVTLDDSIATSIDSKGHGLQRALIFAYIRAYAKIINSHPDITGRFKNFILAVEEPELFLHPNGQRKMREVLDNVALTDQIVLCTHSSFFVDMFDYKTMAIVSKAESTEVRQFVGDVFEAENPDDKRKLSKIFRYLSFFDISRSELFFSRKVILVEGDTEKFLIPFLMHKCSEVEKKCDLFANNVSVIDCGGKTNIHIFVRVLNKFKIPYIVVHDADPLDFPMAKGNQSDSEKQKVRMFKENEYIKKCVDRSCGKIITLNPRLEGITGVSLTQTERKGKLDAAFAEYEAKAIADYPPKLQQMVSALSEWSAADWVIEI